MSRVEEDSVVNIVIIGDGTVGKTCLLHCYTNETFLDTYVPTIYEKEDFELSLNGKNYFLKLIDTAGQEDYERVRRLFYKNAHAFVLCYSIDNKASFDNITQKWYKELKTIENWPIPLILVANKIDLRDESNRRSVTLISTEEGEATAQQIFANRFIECSAKENVRVRDTIEEALRAAIHGPIENQSNSGIFCCCDWFKR